MKKICIAMICLSILSGTIAFADTWGEIPFKYMTDNGYLQTGDPNAYVTRQEVARMLAKLPLIDKGSNYIFTDTADVDIVKAAKSGLMRGYDDRTFKPENNITREEIAKVLAPLLSSVQSYDDLTFEDRDNIGVWAYPHVSALVKEGTILGYEDNTFRPKSNITCAELAVIFMKIRDKYTMTDITGNVFNNAPTAPLQFLDIPEGYVGVLNIPSLGLNDLPIVENGEDLDNIKNVAGHFSDTALFDGTVGILGHNFTDKSPWLGKLEDIQVGDIIIWKTKFGIRRYTVTSRQTILAEDWDSLIETGNNRITLITCLAGQSQTHRIAVMAKEVN